MCKGVVSPLILCICVLLLRDCDCDDGVKVSNGILSHNMLNLTMSTSNATDYNVGQNSYKFETVPDIISKYGYPVETHTVTTEDGYLLTVHRIPGSPKAASSGVKTPALLIHGMGASSESFLLMGPERSIGFLLADQGYDVWLGNFRGNCYSRKHLTLSPKDPKFWKFTWHEMGLYDLPAMVDHVLNTTNHRQLFCIGHSMGGTVFFVFASTRPEYNRKIRLFVGLAPAVYLHPLRLNVVIRRMAPLTPLISGVLKEVGLYEIPRLKSLQILLSQSCREGNPLLELCLFVYFTAFGLNKAAFDTTIAPVVFSQVFSGFAVEALVHYAENYLADRFQVFDPTVTMGKVTPEYNLSRVSAPVYLLYADNDIIVHPDAVMRLGSKIPNLVGYYRVPDNLTTHIDLIFAKNVKYIVNDPVIAELEKYK